MKKKGFSQICLYEPNRWNNDDEIEWKENKPFQETIIIKEWRSGRYSNNYVGETKDGRKFYFTPKTFLNAVLKYGMNGHKIIGEFVVRKQSSNKYVLDVLE